MASGFRLRVCHRKAGRLAYLSHLEVTRAIERSVRRARLPYAVTQGFSPKMRIAFGPALPVGTGSEGEYYEVWLERFVPTDEVSGRLEEATPALLAPVEARYVSDDGPSLGASLVIARWTVTLETTMRAEEVSVALEDVTARGELVVEHRGKQKVFEIDEVLPEGVRVEARPGGAFVHVTTRFGPTGSLRPEALIGAALDDRAAAHHVVSITRTGLLAEDESGWSRPL